MHILLAAPGYKPAFRLGGPVIVAAATAEELVRRGHRVTVVTSSSNLDQQMDVPLEQPVRLNGVDVWYFRTDNTIKQTLPFIPYLAKSMGYLYSPKMGAALSKLVPTADVVHTHLPFVYPTLAAGRAAIRNRKALVYHQHGVFHPQRLKFRGFKKSLYISLFEKPLMSKATTLIALTQSEMDDYRALGISTPCRQISIGVDLSEFEMRAPMDLGLPADSLPILFLGRIHPIKGPDKLLQAFCQVHRRIPRAVLVIAGPDEFGLRKSFERAAALHGVGAKVFFPGMVPAAEKTAYMQRAALFCLPSEGEGFSMATLEALASRTPVLISPGCNFPEVENAGCGRITDANPDAIGEALVDLLADPARLKRMGEEGRAFVRERYTWSQVVDRLTSLYEEAVTRVNRRSN